MPKTYAEGGSDWDECFEAKKKEKKIGDKAWNEKCARRRQDLPPGLSAMKPKTSQPAIGSVATSLRGGLATERGWFVYVPLPAPRM
jgi:hypothetical protein